MISNQQFQFNSAKCVDVFFCCCCYWQNNKPVLGYDSDDGIDEIGRKITPLDN